MIKMKWLMRKCSKCKRYTLETGRCPYCGGELFVPHPHRFSPEDKYAKYRIAIKLTKERTLNEA
jgi:H/ACA ribonucleoprotein complex subunit 3